MAKLLARSLYLEFSHILSLRKSIKLSYSVCILWICHSRTCTVCFLILDICSSLQFYSYFYVCADFHFLFAAGAPELPHWGTVKDISILSFLFSRKTSHQRRCTVAIRTGCFFVVFLWLGRLCRSTFLQLKWYLPNRKSRKAFNIIIWI